MIELNAPAVVAEIAELHDAYERALVANDVDALVGFFWDSPQVVRFGVAEHLYGPDAIAAYRQGHTPVFTERKLLRRTIVTLGDGVASVMCELSQSARDQTRHSRQSQVWARFPDVGWRIISAHVSNALPPPPAEAWQVYTERMAATLELSIAPSHLPGVVQNLSRSAAIAAPLLAFSMPDDVEPAPVFTA